MKKTERIEQMYFLAKEQYAEAGIDTDQVIEKIQKMGTRVFSQP